MPPRCLFKEARFRQRISKILNVGRSIPELVGVCGVPANVEEGASVDHFGAHLDASILTWINVGDWTTENTNSTQKPCHLPGSPKGGRCRLRPDLAMTSRYVNRSDDPVRTLSDQVGERIAAAMAGRSAAEVVPLQTFKAV